MSEQPGRDYCAEALESAGMKPNGGAMSGGNHQNGEPQSDGQKKEDAWPTPQSPPAHLISRCAADIIPKPTDFLWQGRIARGKHTAIAGEPGDGKSQLSVCVAATVSKGGEWPCGEGRAPVGSVIILNAEDGADDTVVPRLIA